MDLDSLQCFIDLAHYHNFTKAAEKNFISQPTLSKKVKLLEDQVGQPLLVRNTHSVNLTPAGLIVEEKAKEIILNWQQAQSAIDQLHHQQKANVLKIFINLDQEHVVPYINRLASFKKNFPNIELQLNKDSNLDVRKAVKTGKADIGLTYMSDDKSLDWFSVHQDELVLVGNSLIMERFSSPVELSDIQHCLFYQRVYTHLPFIDQITQNPGVHEKDISDFNTLLNKLKLEASLSVLPRQDVEQVGELVWLPINIPRSQKLISYGCCLKHDTKQKSVSLFRRYVHNFFVKDTY